ncbi:unnamed protein product [Caenorhabditis sp. 36 PRJEB53466]|nr:unnamed protein product [Caenorhabditis sp. 36 PRJEB53466]
MSIVCPGYYFFPIHIYMTMWVFFLSLELPAVVSCFIYRHNAAVDMAARKKPKRHLKKTGLFLAQLFPFLTAFSLYKSEITRDQAAVYLQKNYPQCMYWLHSQAFTVYDYYSNPWIAVCGIGALSIVCVYTVIFFSLGVHTMILLQRLRAHMSSQTYRMHRIALISLSLQVVIPSVLLLCPLYVCFLVVLFDQLEHQTLAANMTIMIGCHSLCSSTVMLLTNPRYRSLTATYFCRLAGKETQRNMRRGIVDPTSTTHRRSFTL